MKVWPLTIAIALLLPSTSYATSNIAARQILKKWGIAYCLFYAAPTSEMKSEAGRTMGAYFQKGMHDDERAYEDVRSYVRSAFDQNSLVSKEDGKKIVLLTCLDLYNDMIFDRVISKQDKYVNHTHD